MTGQILNQSECSRIDGFGSSRIFFLEHRVIPIDYLTFPVDCGNFLISRLFFFPAIHKLTFLFTIDNPIRLLFNLTSLLVCTKLEFCEDNLSVFETL